MCARILLKTCFKTSHQSVTCSSAVGHTGAVDSFLIWKWSVQGVHENKILMKTKLWSLKNDIESNFINISKTHILVCNKTDFLFDFCSPMESTSNLVPIKFSNSLGIFQFRGFCTSCLSLPRFSWPHPNLSGFRLYVIFLEKFT